MNKLLTRPILRINLEALKSNYNLLSKIAKNATCSVVVKNNAYGLGAVEVSKLLYQEGCRNFWVAHAHEGEEIRNTVKDSEIYVLQGVGDDSIDLFIKNNLIPVINTKEQFLLWNNQLKPYVLHVDTGLNRYGLRDHDLEFILSQKKELSHLKMIISHLACADDIGHFMNKYQRDNFERISAKFNGVKRALSASDGLFLGDKFTYDYVRAGAALYGINTAPYRENQMKPVISIEAPVVQVEILPLGAYAGYGITYRAHQEKKIAIISIGYADGIPCSLKNIGKIWFKDSLGKLYESRVIGRISMDLTICDITQIPKNVVKIGSMASLINEHYTVDDMGRDAGTIGYEILSRLGNRYLRYYDE